MAYITIRELLEAGVHFGHLKRKWNPFFISVKYHATFELKLLAFYKYVEKIFRSSVISAREKKI